MNKYFHNDLIIDFKVIKELEKYHKHEFLVYIRDKGKSHVSSDSIVAYLSKTIMSYTVDRYKGCILIDVE